MAAELEANDEARRLDLLVRELRTAFPEVPGEQVRSVVAGTWLRFRGAPVRDYVPLLVRRRVISQLRMT
jgi:hypothetical protein